jgi:hypothetical protein
MSHQTIVQPSRNGQHAAHVHAGQAETVRQKRQIVLRRAFQAHPERFVKGPPQPAQLPAAAWINPPKPAALAARLTDDEPPCPALPSASAPAIAPPADVRYTAVSGPEDRATLRSDLSAVPADGVAAQSRHRTRATLPATGRKKELHCP